MGGVSETVDIFDPEFSRLINRMITFILQCIILKTVGSMHLRTSLDPSTNIEPSSSPPTPVITIGTPVIVHDTLHGILLFTGKTKFGSNPSNDVWYGICLTPPDTGKNDGTVLGIKYFECSKGLGLFTRLDNVRIDDGTQTASAAMNAIDKIGSNEDDQVTIVPSKPHEDDQVTIIPSKPVDDQVTIIPSKPETTGGVSRGPVEKIMKTISPSQVPIGVASADQYLSALDAKINNLVRSDNVQDESTGNDIKHLDPVLDKTDTEQDTLVNNELDTKMEAMKEANVQAQNQLSGTFAGTRPLDESNNGGVVPGMGELE